MFEFNNYQVGRDHEFCNETHMHLHIGERFQPPSA
jgi:hypothetical protein